MSEETVQEKTGGGRLRAVWLGLLTFFITGLLALLAVILLLPFGINLSGLLLYGAFGGYAFAQLTLLILFALLGNLGAAIISWRINHSKKLAKVTFASAVIFQVIATVILVWVTLKESREVRNAGMARQAVYEQYAKIGNVRVEPQDPFEFVYALDGKLIEVTLFKKLVFTVPVSVTRPGNYAVHIKYTSNSQFYANSDSSPSVTQILDAGDHLIKIEFMAGEAPNLGYEPPSSVEGRVSVELDRLETKKELLSFLKSGDNIDPKALQRFMKDEGLKQEVNLDSVVNKFVGRKDVQF